MNSYTKVILILAISLCLVYPVSAATFINHTVATTDGGFVKSIHNSTVAALRNNATGSGDYGSTPAAYLTSDTVTDEWYSDYRGALIFNLTGFTGSVSDITAAKVGLYIQNKYTTGGDSGVGLVKFTIDGAIDNPDYNNFGETLYTGYINTSTMNAWANYSLNSAGLSNITTSPFGFMVVNQYDFENVSPSWVASTIYGAAFYSSESGGGTKTPFIEITYTAIPTSSFTASSSTGPSPLLVALTDTSNNTPTAWSWYEDGVLFSNTQHPILTLSEGTHQIVLNASNSKGGSNSSATTITVTPGIELFNQNYTALGSIPSNIANSYDQSPYISTVTTGYENGIMYGCWSETKIGKLFVGGLTPSVNTTYNIIANVTYTNTNSLMYIYTGRCWVALYPSGTNLRVVNYYQWPNSTARSDYVDVPLGGISYPLPITIKFDGVNQSYTTSIRGYSVTTPLRGGIDTPYNAVSSDTLWFSSYAPAGETAAKWYIHSITQTVSKATGNITAIGDKSLVSFGFDGPHPAGTWENSESIVEAAGGKYTVWADIGPTMSTPANIANVTRLLAKGYGLGIHFSTRLTDLTLPNANATIDSEVATITATYGQAPTTWSSLANADNITHAEYAYNTHGMIWRNGRMAVQELDNVGNLDNDTWPFWLNASAAGVTVRSFTHETASEPAIAYSIDPSKFQSWVNNYASHGMKISPYINWYKTGDNSNSATFTENEATATILNFTAHTNGYPAFVEAAIVNTSTRNIYNMSGNLGIVPRTAAPDGNMQFYVGNGFTYYIGETPPATTPVAAFTATVSDSTVTFTDTSTNTPTSWLWQYNQHEAPAWVQFSTDANPSYNFVEGTYDINLTATNAAGSDSEVKYGYIVVTASGAMLTENPQNVQSQKGAGYIMVALNLIGMGFIVGGGLLLVGMFMRKGVMGRGGSTTDSGLVGTMAAGILSILIGATFLLVTYAILGPLFNVVGV